MSAFGTAPGSGGLFQPTQVHLVPKNEELVGGERSSSQLDGLETQTIFRHESQKNGRKTSA